MLRKLDGITINTQSISTIEAGCILGAEEDCYKIKFTIYERDLYGKTRYKTEADCLEAIDNILKEING